MSGQRNRKDRRKRRSACGGMVEEDGFEPSKAKPADLQSVPFGHLGTPPYSICGKGGAGGRIRTPDLLITNQLLYRLSYTSTGALSAHNVDYYSSRRRACQQFSEKNTKRRSDRKGRGKTAGEDRDWQRELACALCAGELYPGDHYFELDGRTVCEDCLARYAKRYFAHRRRRVGRDGESRER